MDTARRGMKVWWGMAAAARRSGLAGSAVERYASEAVVHRAWLSQQPSAGGDERADGNEYIDERIFYLEMERGVWASVTWPTNGASEHYR